jgi:hypothetical protein
MEISVWSVLFFFGVGFILLLSVPLQLRNWPRPLLYIFLWLLPVSRIVEISYAFFADALGYISGKPKRRKITPAQRVVLLGLSYVEVSVNFAVVYLSFPLSSFYEPLKSAMQAWYLSWMTITTTGYGDITPQTDLARFICMAEVGIGLTLIVIAVGAYLSAKSESSA